MKKTFNIIGCCASRDIFRLNNNPKFVIKNFVQSVCPVSIMTKEQDLKLVSSEDLIDFGWKNLIKKIFCYNINKNIQKIIKKNKTDYLILDLCELRFDKMKMTHGNIQTIITKSQLISDVLKEPEKFPKFNEFYFEDLEMSDEEIFDYLDQYMNFIFSCYKPSKVIMLEILPTLKAFDDKKSCFSKFNQKTTLKEQETISKFYDYIKEKYPQIHFVKNLNNSLGDVNHTWGKGSLHFANEYYEYLYKCIESIVFNKKCNPQTLEDLQKCYFEKFSKLEEEKRIVYYSLQAKPESILKNSKFETTSQDEVVDWKLSLSETSSFDAKTKTLTTNEDKNCFAILSQRIDISHLKPNEWLTFSLKFKTSKYSSVNIAFREFRNGSFKFPQTTIVSNSEFTVDSVTYEIPENISDFEFIDVAIFVNSRNAAVTIQECKLEKGKHSSLF